MTQTEINQVVEAMQLSPKYKNILRKCLNGDNEEVKNAIKNLNDADIELNTKLNELANKVNNLKTDVFTVVDSLPTENIENKIYCVKDTTDGGTNNKFIEYIYIETTKSWEKVGEFKADPDLSGYAKLSGAKFTGDVAIGYIKFGGYDVFIPRGLNFIQNNASISFPNVVNANNANKTIAVGTQNNFLDVGTTEDFIFTLEDGTTVTKTIRVISTTKN